MNQSNYDQYGYDHYDQAPHSRKAGSTNLLESIVGPAAAEKFRSPLVSTIGLLLVGVAFAAIIVASYPQPEEGIENVPVIKAETTAFKIQAEEPGGMDVPHRDSTIFTTMNDGNIPEKPPIENLLDQEDPVDTNEAFSNEAEDADTETAAAQDLLDITETTAREVSEVADELVKDESVKIQSAVDESPKKPETDQTLASVEDVADQEAAGSRVEVQKIIQDVKKIPPQEIAAAEAADMDADARPAIRHAPASSPETIAFVRSVLDKKDNVSVKAAASPKVAEAQAANMAEAMSKIEPAAGPAITSGSFYVQLGSVKTESGAAGEWSKLQKSFPGNLQGLEYRVQKAELGDRGTFFRIQAGPMSKDSASSVCDSIKAQKPGGCLVVQ